MNRRLWTEAEIAYVRDRYPHDPTADIARAIGRTVGKVYARAAKLGLNKTAEFMASPAACRLRRGDNVGAAFRFKKGQVPPNKGVRRPGWAPGRMKETQFKKGEATNWMPIGTTRLVDGYVYRKVSDHRNVPWTRNWVPENRIVWEAANGPVPEGHALAYRNRDRTDNRLENLELITRGELVKRNSVHNLPPELKKTVYALGRLKRRIRREEQNRRSA